MTETTTDRYEHIRHHEYETDPFTAAELDAVDAYGERTAGIPDSLEFPGAMPSEFTLGEELGCYKSMFSLLRDWREAIVGLADALRDHYPVGDRISSDGMSTAARRYVASQICEWHQSREQLHSDLVTRLLGKDEWDYQVSPSLHPLGCRVVDGMFWIDAGI